LLYWSQLVKHLSFHRGSLRLKSVKPFEFQVLEFVKKKSLVQEFYCKSITLKLLNRIALVTGAGRGMGRGIALQLATEGADIVVNYAKSKERADQLCREVNSIGRKSVSMRADVSSEIEVKKMFEETKEIFGEIDILVNNAGIERLCLLENMSYDSWKIVLETNLGGAFLCSKYAIPILNKNGNGRIVNIVSDAGKTGYKYLSAYCASKFGLIGLTQSLAIELSQKKITVNAVCPGATDTDMLSWEYDELAKIENTRAEQQKEILYNRIPLGRIASPKEIGELIVYLSSDAGSFITGESINISGGMEVH
jgi:3-oxoacyl-[acyl-carrier protein] reductase